MAGVSVAVMVTCAAAVMVVLLSGNMRPTPCCSSHLLLLSLAAPLTCCSSHLLLLSLAAQMPSMTAEQSLHTLTVSLETHALTHSSPLTIFNPRRACARVTVVVLCVCVSVHGSNLLVAQLRDKLVILTGSVSWSLQNEFYYCVTE